DLLNSEFYITTSAGGTLTIGPDVRIRGEGGTIGRLFFGSSSVVNQGTISADVSGRFIRVIAIDSGRITNNGLFETRNGGRILMDTPNPLTNRVGNMLVGGRWSALAGSNLDLPSTAIEINSADVTLSGPGSLFAAMDPINDNRGSFTLDAGRD